MDIVYIVGPDPVNNPLRYSLRSLSNIPHDRVWLVGGGPGWVRNVERIEVSQRGPKHNNTWDNWAAVAENGPEEFLLFNDDFFAMERVESVPVWHRGPLNEAINEYLEAPALKNWRRRSIVTRDGLSSIGRDPADMSWYELHAPLPVNRGMLRDAVDDLGKVAGGNIALYSKRTWYGNHAGIGGVRRKDCKTQAANGVHLAESRFRPFLSTSPRSWTGTAGKLVRNTFKATCGYEQIGERYGQGKSTGRRQLPTGSRR